jgi:iron complex outermembrane receptor protein
MNYNKLSMKVACLMGIEALYLSSSYSIASAAELEEVTENKESKGLEVITITSRKRVENLQETPLSVMAFGAKELEKTNVSDLIDMSTKLPNVNLTAAGGSGSNNASFTIRGLGSGSRNSPNSENSVGLYIDDAYYGKTDGAILEVIDVDQIEVLRGPQGTLFGRNSTAGAIRYVTKKPHFDGNDGSIKATLGNYSRADLRVAANLVLSDELATRWTVASINRDGHVDNQLTGKDIGDKNLIAVRGAFFLDANKDLDLHLSLEHTESDTNGAPAVATIANETPNGGIWGAPFAATENAENLAAYGFTHENTPTNNFYHSYSSENTFSKSDSFGANFVADYAINDQVDFKSATTYRTLDTDVLYDMDGVAAELVARTMEREIEVFTQELQLSGSTDTMDWVGGVFYLDESVTAFQDDLRMINAATAPNGISGGQLVDPHKTTSYAIFGQVTYRIKDDFAITTGLRYTRDEKEQVVFDLPTGVPQTRDNVVLEARDSDSWSAPSGRISLEWNATNEIFAFASYARGFRAGGLNDEGQVGVLSPEGFGSYDEEVIDSFEVGLRSDLLDNRLRFNLTAFYMEAQDLQFTVLLDANESETVTQNAGEAEIMGLEAEITAVLSDYVTFSLDAGLLDTEYVEVPALVDELDPIEAGDPLTNAPEFSYSANLDVDIPVTEGFLTFNLNYGYKDDYSLFPGIASVQESFGLLGTNLTYESDEGDWKVSLFGTNLTDEEYGNIIMDIGGSSGAALGFRMVEPGRPREYGVALTYNF